MTTNRRWVGWLAIGLGVVALVVALMGRGFGPSVAAAGFNNRGAPQAYAQQGPGMPGGQNAPGANVQPNAGPQANGSQNSPGALGGNAQPGMGAPMAGQGRGQGHTGAGPRPANGGAGDRGFGASGWFGFLPRLGGLFQTGLLALLVVAGLWLIRGRNTGTAPAAPAHEPAPQAADPEAEAYIDEPRDQE